MRNRLTAVVFVSAALAGGCTTAGGTPATTPPVTATTAAPPTTTTIAPTTITVVEPETTTTLDRLAEIQAIFEDLERRRLQAIYDQDEAAFRSLYANDEYLSLELESFERVHVLDADAVILSLESVLYDDAECIAAIVQVDASDAFVTGGSYRTTVVVETRDGSLGYSWVGEGWACEGSHPLSG